MALLRSSLGLALAIALLTGRTTPAEARPDQAMLDDFKAAYPELFDGSNDGRLRPSAVPDIFGPGAVLDVGRLHMKITNFDIIGNPFFNLSSDPSAQWPGASGIEYLSFILLGVGGVDKTATDPAAVRRVSLQPEWRPPTLAPEDRMYKSFDGKVFGQRLVDDDLDANAKDPLERAMSVDEDFQDGRDTDGDGEIDEDYGAIGQLMWSCTMLDNTQQATQAAANEKHVPLNLELRQVAFAFSVPGFQDFNAIHWTVINRSGHPIDSMYLGIRCDVDAGPADSPTYFTDDVDIPFFPRGDFTVVLNPDDKWGQKLDPKGYRRQLPHAIIGSLNPDSASLPLCPRVNIRVNGFSVVDDEGDAGRTTGIASLLLLGHTTDPMGLMGPKRVGWTQFRSHLAGTPFASGGQPVVDQQRMDMFVSGENIDPETGFISAVPVDQAGDIQAFGSIGPFGATDDQGKAHPIPDGGSIELTIAFAVQRGDNTTVNQYPGDYQKYLSGEMTSTVLFDKYPALENAFAAQVAYEGVWDDPPSVLNDNEHINIPDFHGRETRVRAPAGFILTDEDCREEGVRRQITEFSYTWFDFDCDWCTGVWVFGSGPDFGGGPGSGKMLKRWNTAAPPPNPEVNTSATVNFSDNPWRPVAPGQDNRIVLAWDNLPEVSKDPESGLLDFRSYRLWKVSDWRRPSGTTGPSDEEWRLLAQFRYFDYLDNNRERFTTDQMTARGFHRSARDSVAGGIAVCPQVFIPNLSLQTVVFQKSDFATPQDVQAWLQGPESDAESVRQHVNANGGFQPDRVDDAGSTWRYRVSDGDCKPGSFHTVGLKTSATPNVPSVWAEACINPLAISRGFTVPICLNSGDLWDPQSAAILRPVPENCPARAADGSCLADTIACAKDPSGACEVVTARAVGQTNPISRTRYPVGRYRYDDLEVKNGFLYFYAVTAGDSVGNTELTGRRSGVEADAVFPQIGTRPAGQVWVVPNPYRGYPQIARRPSSWDLEPNATDPTGTHLDFMGLPRGPWTIRIFTVSGDLVQTLNSDDAINDSVRGPTTVPNPNYNPALGDDPVNNPRSITLQGFNRQQDSRNDGQARWNLISRNGQDVVSGVYIFVVESQGGTQRGKFVVIR